MGRSRLVWCNEVPAGRDAWSVGSSKQGLSGTCPRRLQASQSGTDVGRKRGRCWGMLLVGRVHQTKEIVPAESQRLGSIWPVQGRAHDLEWLRMGFVLRGGAEEAGEAGAQQTMTSP